MVLPLVQSRVDVTVTAPGFQPFSAADVPTSDLSTITLTPAGVPFSGTLAFVPGPRRGTALTDAARNVRFSVQSAPPGVGQLSLTAVVVGATPTVVWSDSSQGTDVTGPSGSRLIRPGTYTVTATLPGYDLAPMTFTVDPGVAMPRPPDPDALVFTLRKFGFLRVTVGTTQNPALLVQGAIVTLTLQDGTTQQREAHPGDTHVDFGDLPTGDYTVEVRAPGHQRVTTSVRLDAGDAPADDKLVTVRRLGLVQGTVMSVLTTGLEQELPGAQIAVRQGVAGHAVRRHHRPDGDVPRHRHDGHGRPGAGRVAGRGDGPGARHRPRDRGPGRPTSFGNLDVTVPTIRLPAKNGGLQVRAYDGTTVVPGLTMQLSYLDSTGPRTITPTCGPDNSTAPCPGGLYVFFDVPPLTYNLNISGPTYSPLSLPVTIPPGETPSISVPMTTPSGSIQGLVQHQRAGRAARPRGRRRRDADPADRRRPDRDVRRQRPVRVPGRGGRHLHRLDDGRRARRHPDRRRAARAGHRRRPAAPGRHPAGPGHRHVRERHGPHGRAGQPDERDARPGRPRSRWSARARAPARTRRRSTRCPPARGPSRCPVPPGTWARTRPRSTCPRPGPGRCRPR